VDDGVASGFTLGLAVEAVRRAGAARVEIAVPTGPLAALERLLEVADAVTCANVRTAQRFAVADAYRTWFDESDAEVLRLLTDRAGHAAHS
jgi:putative phosphoribosyl transferase